MSKCLESFYTYQYIIHLIPNYAIIKFYVKMLNAVVISKSAVYIVLFF